MPISERVMEISGAVEVVRDLIRGDRERRLNVARAIEEHRAGLQNPIERVCDMLLRERRDSHPSPELVAVFSGEILPYLKTITDPDIAARVLIAYLNNAIHNVEAAGSIDAYLDAAKQWLNQLRRTSRETS